MLFKPFVHIYHSGLFSAAEAAPHGPHPRPVLGVEAEVDDGMEDDGHVDKAVEGHVRLECDDGVW